MVISSLKVLNVPNRGSLTYPALWLLLKGFFIGIFKKEGFLEPVSYLTIGGIKS
jgi:hypothetical protein